MIVPLCAGLVFCGLDPCGAASIQEQKLEAEIAKLRTEVSGKSAALEECAKKTKNFKIAGGVLLGVTAAGVAANVGLAVANKKLNKKIGTARTEIEELKAKLLEDKDTSEASSEDLDEAKTEIFKTANETHSN